MSDSTAAPPMASPKIKAFAKSETMTTVPAKDFDIEEYFVRCSSKIIADNSLVQWILILTLHCHIS